MKPSKTFRAAAKRVHKSRRRLSICEAVDAVTLDAMIKDGDYDTNDRFLVLYVNLFAPPDRFTGGYWGDLWSRKAAEARDCRVLALLFMRAMAKADGR